MSDAFTAAHLPAVIQPEFLDCGGRYLGGYGGEASILTRSWTLSKALFSDAAANTTTVPLIAPLHELDGVPGELHAASTEAAAAHAPSRATL
jgi:hypothetical protein